MGRHVSTADHRSEEEPVVAELHLARSHHERNHHRSQCLRIGTRYSGRKSDLGQIRASHQSSGERRMYQCRAVGVKKKTREKLNILWFLGRVSCVLFFIEGEDSESEHSRRVQSELVCPIFSFPQFSISSSVFFFSQFERPSFCCIYVVGICNAVFFY